MTTQRRSPSPPSTPEAASILEALLAEHGPELRRQAARHAPAPEYAEDALQDACCQLLRCYQGPPGLDALRWMMTTTKRCAWAIARRDRRQPQLSLSTTDAIEPGEEGAVVSAGDDRLSPDALVERAERHRLACLAMARLKPDQRTALLMLGIGLSYREIGRLRGWTYTKVNRCVTEGRATLRRDRRRG
jgi:RNA polymerase sigma factor (sigma-70 family)